MFIETYVAIFMLAVLVPIALLMQSQRAYRARLDDWRGPTPRAWRGTPTGAQRAKLDTLASVIEMEEAEVTVEHDGTVIFEGYSADGLAVGIIDANGSIDWVCGEVSLA